MTKLDLISIIISLIMGVVYPTILLFVVTLINL
jgi:hypothetical protein